MLHSSVSLYFWIIYINSVIGSTLPIISFQFFPIINNVYMFLKLFKAYSLLYIPWQYYETCIFSMKKLSARYKCNMLHYLSFCVVLFAPLWPYLAFNFSVIATTYAPFLISCHIGVHIFFSSSYSWIPFVCFGFTCHFKNVNFWGV